eukprot:TRINITY_DN8623_c0_g1_i1.p1 TRINITY_DN8623_c0_g1~~TRINITY_DN8623_c0_g1_i1.p1  ORF type:complete len:205 (+),score=41.89 TRINITY_DN8623_c0_g1_i1:151-765(+)
MKKATISIFALVLLSSYGFIGVQSQGQIFAAYAIDWLKWVNEKTCSFSYDDLDVSKLTHLVIAFANFDSNFNVVPWQDDDTTGYYGQTVTVKSRNPNLKILISIGGAGSSSPFPSMVSSSTNINKFVKSAFDFVRKWGWDGIDIDWEGPNSASETQGFVNLWKALREAADSEVIPQGKSKMVITAAVGPGQSGGNSYNANASSA